MNPTDDFKLLNYVAADLRRARLLVHGPEASLSAIQLWLGIFSPRFAPVLLCRLAYCLYRLRLTPLAKIVSLLNFFLFGIEIALRCPIGRGLFLPHSQGTVIGAWSIGENATIFQGVTLGAKELDFSYQELSRPKVLDGVTIGSGAKILGGITLNSGSRVGANSVVLSDVEQGALVVGIPAKVVNSKM